MAKTKKTNLDKILVASCILIILISIFLKIFLLSNQPLGFDESSEGSIADGINNGKVPYLDFFDHKTPLNHYFLSFIFKIFGESVFSIHLLAFIYFILLLIASFFITKKFFNYKYALIVSAFLCIFISSDLSTEIPMTLFGLLGLFLYSLSFDNKNKLLPIFSGIFLAISCWFKQPGILFLFVVIIHQIYLILRKKATLKKSFKQLYLILAGFLLVSIPLFSYFIYKVGFSKMYYDLVTFNFLFKGSTPRILQIGKLFSFLLSFWILFAIIIYSRKNSETEQGSKQISKEICFTTSFILILFFLINKEIFFNHIYQLIPFLFILSMFYLSYIKNKETKNLAILFIILFLFSVLFINLESTARIQQSQDLNKQLEVSSYIDSLNSTKIFSSEPQYYFLSNITCNYKVCFLAPSVASVFDFSDFCNYSSTLDYLVFSHREKYLGNENIACINKKFSLIKTFDNIGESYIEIWKNNKVKVI